MFTVLKEDIDLYSPTVTDIVYNTINKINIKNVYIISLESFKNRFLNMYSADSLCLFYLIVEHMLSSIDKLLYVDDYYNVTEYLDSIFAAVVNDLANNICSDIPNIDKIFEKVSKDTIDEDDCEYYNVLLGYVFNKTKCENATIPIKWDINNNELLLYTTNVDTVDIVEIPY